MASGETVSCLVRWEESVGGGPRAEGKLGVVCAALVVGEAVGLSTGGGAAAWPLVGLVAMLFAVFGFARAWRFWPVGLFFFLGLALAMRAADARHKALTEIALRHGPYEASFVVTGEPRVGAADERGVRWVSFPTRFPGGKLTVVMQQPATNAVPRVGESWTCTGWLSRQGADNGRGACLWVRGRGTHAERVRMAESHALDVVLARTRRVLSQRLGVGLEGQPQVADLHRAMLLGERSSLPGEMRETFVRAGTVHVFAISGLHVMVVARILLYALVIMMFPVRWAGVVLMPVLALYVLMIGASPSAIRAAAMAGVYYAAPVFWRRSNGLTAWEVTLIVFALIDPIGLFGVGSMLSFAVMLAILLAMRWARPFGSCVVAALALPFAAWVAGVPIVAHFFGSLSVGGLVANLVTVPLAGAAVLTGAMGLVASFVSQTLAAHVNNLAALFTAAMAGVSWAVAQVPGSNVVLAPWPVPVCLGWYAGVVLLFVWIRMVWQRRRCAFA